MMRRPLIALAISSILITTACGDSGGGNSTADFCRIFIEQDAVEFSDESDPAEALAALNRLKDAAPGEIEDDVALAVDGFAALTEVDLENATEEDFAALEAQFEGATEAADRVEAWVRANCDDLPEDFLQS